MTRLRRVSPRSRGWTRRRVGTGFRYTDADGHPLPASEVDRIRALAIPPAWRDVWICPVPNGHLQAVGTDDAGRRQYLYHPDWRTGRDQQKFERVLAAGTRLATARPRVVKDLTANGMPMHRATAAAVRLLDQGAFRIGSDAYTDANGSFGLTTLERRHVRRIRGALRFSFVGKSGIAHVVIVDDPMAIAALDVMRHRRGVGERLLAYRGPGGWRDVDAPMVNDYLADLLDVEFTAKDFRTWHATVLAARALADTPEPGDTAASRRRAVKAAVEEVAAYLGNTPTIAKGSYIDPRVLGEYEEGRTISTDAAARRRNPDRRQAALEQAVVRLLRT
jgi:DNA topoisomerase-1